MKKILLLVALLSLAGCASVRKVETGVNNVGERFSIHLDGPWNHLDFPGIKPAQVWTMEGLTIDELLIYSGIKDGQIMHPELASSKKKSVIFRGNMQTDEIVSMFESMLTRDDSAFNLLRVEPSTFGGKKGFLFEYERIRKIDNVRQLGFGYGAVDNGELFALVYTAPALTFFPRHKARVEAIAHTAYIKPNGNSSYVASQLAPPTKLTLQVPVATSTPATLAKDSSPVVPPAAATTK